MSLTGQPTQRNNDSTPAGRMRPADTKPGVPKRTPKAKMPPRKTWIWFVVGIRGIDTADTDFLQFRDILVINPLKCPV